jgi:Ca2+-binding EF-hand superfamily protein
MGGSWSGSRDATVDVFIPPGQRSPGTFLTDDLRLPDYRQYAVEGFDDGPPPAPVFSPPGSPVTAKHLSGAKASLKIDVDKAAQSEKEREAEETEALRQVFRQAQGMEPVPFDDDDGIGDGSLHMDELRLALEWLGRAPQSEKEAAVLFESADWNGNGTIEFNEFCALARGEDPHDQMGVLSEVFKVFDIDGSGYIERHELQRVFKRLNTEDFKMSEEERNYMVDALLAEADVSGDGKIDEAEFVRVFATYQAPSA